MAGGLLAETVTCVPCLMEGRLTRAVRVYEGAETDQYRCELGDTFGIDYARGPATEPDWPPTPDSEAFAQEQQKGTP